jgi:hypothetical protein
MPCAHGACSRAILLFTCFRLNKNKTMTTNCKNCDTHFEGNFCNNCGQTADTQRLDFHFLRRNVQKLLFKYFDKGIFYTTKELFSRPGNTIREYIEGKRVRHFEPIALLVTIATLYGVLFHYFHINLFKDISSTDTTLGKIEFDTINEWIATHFSLFSVLFLPLYTVGSFVAFRKQGYNFTEHLILNTFLASQRLLVRLAAFPILIIYNRTEHLQAFMRLFILCDFVLLIWGYGQFFNGLKRVKSFFLTVLSYLIFLICYLLVIVIALLIFEIINNNALQK